MPSLSDIRRRITSVKNTRKITRAMKLVASAKLKKAKDAATAAQPYQQTLQRVLERVVTSVADIERRRGVPRSASMATSLFVYSLLPLGGSPIGGSGPPRVTVSVFALCASHQG